MTTIAQDEPRHVTGGVDTHKDIHVAAVLDDIGRLLATESFPTTRPGYRDWFAKASDFAAGMGDAVSCGLTTRVRTALGYNDAVDTTGQPATTANSRPRLPGVRGSFVGSVDAATGAMSSSGRVAS